MKSVQFIIIVLFIAQVSISQEEESYRTIFGSARNPRVSGFGGLINEISGLDGNVVHQIGIQGAVLLNQSLYMGLYGQGMTSFPKYDITYYNELAGQNYSETMRLAFLHGGLIVGGVVRPNHPIHFGGSLKIGWGAYTLNPDFFGVNNPGSDPYYYQEFSDFVFVASPQIEVEFNITSWFKVNTGIGYRFVSGLDQKYTVREGGFVFVEKPIFRTDAFNAPTFQIGLLFGGFR